MTGLSKLLFLLRICVENIPKYLRKEGMRQMGQMTTNKAVYIF